MIAKVYVYTPLGTFESDAKEITPEQEEKMKYLMANLYNINVFEIENQSGTLYIPREVITRSIVKLQLYDENSEHPG